MQDQELENIMQKMGRRYNKDEISGVIKSLDKSDDGKIGFHEFFQ